MDIYVYIYIDRDRERYEMYVLSIRMYIRMYIYIYVVVHLMLQCYGKHKSDGSPLATNSGLQAPADPGPDKALWTLARSSQQQTGAPRAAGGSIVE